MSTALHPRLLVKLLRGAWNGAAILRQGAQHSKPGAQERVAVDLQVQLRGIYSHCSFQVVEPGRCISTQVGSLWEPLPSSRPRSSRRNLKTGRGSGPPRRADKKKAKEERAKARAKRGGSRHRTSRHQESKKPQKPPTNNQ